MIANIESLHSAIQARADARAGLERASEALSRARKYHAEAQRERNRVAQADEAYLTRHTKRVTEWITGGSKGNQPQPIADVKTMTARVAADATLKAAAVAVAHFEEAERKWLGNVEVAERRVFELKRAHHVMRRDELLDRMRVCLAEYGELRGELGATAAAAELFGIQSAFTNILTAQQLDTLNSPVPVLPPVGDIFTPTKRMAGDLNTPICGAPELLDRYLARWRALDAELESAAPPAAEAAA